MTYEYHCDACGSDLEIEQKITEPPLSECPKCKSTAIKRLVSATNFVLKGSRWAKDGYS